MDAVSGVLIVLLITVWVALATRAPNHEVKEAAREYVTIGRD